MDNDDTDFCFAFIQNLTVSFGGNKCRTRVVNMFGTDVNDELVEKYRPLVAEVFKLLAELSVDARAHGFDVSPYLQRLIHLGAPSCSAGNVVTTPARNH